MFSRYLVYGSKLIVFVAVYFIAAKLGLLAAFVGGNASPVWPPTGIALAILLIFGFEFFPVIMIGTFLAVMTTNVPIGTMIGISVGNTLEALVGVYLLRRVANFHTSLDRVKDVVSLVFFSAFLSTTLSATIGVASLCAGGAMSWENYGLVWFTWWLGNVLGSLIVAPVAFMWVPFPRLKFQTSQVMELIGMFVLSSIICWMVFFLSFMIGVRDYPVAFIIFPFVLGAAIRFDQRMTVSITFLVSIIAIIGTAMGHGPFSRETLNESLLLLQSFLAIVGFTGMVTAAIMKERREAEKRTHHINRLYAMLSQTNQGIVRIAERTELLNYICRVAIDYGLFEFAWIGTIDEQTNTMHTTARHAKRDMLSAIDVSQLPNAFTLPLAERAPIVCNDFAHDSHPELQQRIAAKINYRSYAAFPISSNGRVIGVLTVCAAAVDFFTEDEIKLLGEIALDISFALEAMDVEKRRREIAERLQLTVDNLTIVAFELDAQGKFLLSRGKGLEKLGLKPDEVVGMSAFQLYKDHPVIIRALRTALTGLPQHYEVEINGLVWESHVVPLADSSGKIERLFGTAIDITDRKLAEQKLRESELKYRTLIEQMNEGLVYIDLDGNIQFVNNRFCEMVGYPRAELLRKMMSELLATEEDRKLAEEKHQLHLQGITSRCDIQLRKKSQDIIWVHVSCAPVFDANGEVIGSTGVYTDITERKRSEVLLRQAKDYTEKLIETANVMVIGLDGAGNLTVFNSAAEKLTGYSHGELVGKNWFEVLVPKDKYPHVWDEFLRLMEGGMPEVFENPILTKSGEERLITWQNSHLRENGTIIGTISFGIDITDRKRAEKALRESEQKYRRIVETAQEGIWMVDAEARTSFVNSKMAAMLGYTVDEMAGQSLFNFMDDVGRKTALMYLDRRHRGISEEHEFTFRRKDNSELLARLSSNPIFDEHGTYAGSLAMVADITARTLAEENLRKSEEMYRDLVENISEVFYIAGPDGKLVYSSPNLFLATGYSPAELKDVSYHHFIDGEDLRRVVEFYHARTREGTLDTSIEFRARRKDGSCFWIEQRTRIIRDDKGSVVEYRNVFSDITKRKQAEEGREQSEERYRKYFEEDLTGVFVSTPRGDILTCNPAYARMFGFSSIEEATKCNFFSLIANPIAQQAFIRQLVTEKKLVNYEGELQHRDGRKLYVIQNIIGTYNKKDELTEIKGYLFDDTRRRELEKQLRQSQKMESLGTLAGGIAHDFNNLLSIISIYSSILEGEEIEKDKVHESFGAIIKATQRGSALVKQLLTFARKTDVLFESVRLNDVVRDIAKLMKETFPKTINVVLDLESDLPSIIADSNQIHQVFMNLCVNARDAMPQGGTLSISTKRIPGERVQKKFQKASAASYVQAVVVDTGLGMEEVTRSRIFEPFFTTKELGKGTGLGLAVVYGIMENHQAFIDVGSERGRGTTFHLYFPVDVRPREPMEIHPEKLKNIPGGTEGILVVEDEELLKYMLKNILERKGYRVFTASDGEEAVETYRQHSKQIALVLSDVGLPRLSGSLAFLKMKQINPHLKMILASGYLDPEMKYEMLKEGAKEFIQKPYMPEDILKRVRAVIDSV